MKLQSLKPRLATLVTQRVPTMQPDSWRTDKQGSTARGYGYRWQKARERFLKANPLCATCEAAGRVEAATVVDHKEPHRGDERLFWDERNWQGLCKPHHDEKTGRGG